MSTRTGNCGRRSRTRWCIRAVAWRQCADEPISTGDFENPVEEVTIDDAVQASDGELIA
jgi:hypothetical protein